MNGPSTPNDGARPVLVCYHGSPGGPTDFAELAKALPRIAVRRLVRAGYPASPDDTTGPTEPPKQPCFFLGYSYGSVACLEAAAAAPSRVLGIVLVAPFLRASKPMGGLKKALLGMPSVGRFLVGRAAPKAVDEFLRKTSSPNPIPPHYLEQSAYLRNPDVLLRALLEKEEPRPSLEAITSTLASARIPCVAVWGAKDGVGHREDHISPLEAALPNLSVRVLDDAGHAIPWTHSGVLAEIVSTFISSTMEKAR